MTDIAKRYRFSDFTLLNYKRLLDLARNNYSFRFFNEEIHDDEKIIFLRHDVEFSVPIALKMSEIEAELGIKSTYFIQIHGDFYNILEKRHYEAIKKIQTLGHQIALHFDAHFWDITSEADLTKCLLIDISTIREYFNIAPVAFSFHNTNEHLLSFGNDSYAGLINVYSRKMKEFSSYCSDSTGYWRYEILEDKLMDAKDLRLQILIHDGMWQDEVLPPRRRIYKIIDDNARYLQKSYDETLKKFNASNIDWEGLL